MNASISDAEAPFSHLLRSRFHIKLVIAYDPARHHSHSGGPCYMNEIWWNANIYAHTFAFGAFSIIASASALKEEQLSFDTSNYIEEYTSRWACTRAWTLKPPQPRKCAQNCAGLSGHRFVCNRLLADAVSSAVASWPPSSSSSCWEGHLSGSELGCGRLASPGGLQREREGVSEGHFPLSPAL